MLKNIFFQLFILCVFYSCCKEKNTINTSPSYSFLYPNVNVSFNSILKEDFKKFEFDPSVEIYKKKIEDNTTIYYFTDSLNNIVESVAWEIILQSLDSNILQKTFNPSSTITSSILTKIDYDMLLLDETERQQFCVQNIFTNRIFVCKLQKRKEDYKLFISYDFIKKI